MRVALVVWGLAECARACFPQSTDGPNQGQGTPISNVNPLDRNQLLRDTCEDLILYQLFERGNVERYQFEYSTTVAGNRHPPTSTVTVRCKENNEDARVFAYANKPENPVSVSEELIMSSPDVTAVCDPVSKKWMVSNRDFRQVYCSQQPPRANLFL